MMTGYTKSHAAASQRQHRDNKKTADKARRKEAERIATDRLRAQFRTHYEVFVREALKHLEAMEEER